MDLSMMSGKDIIVDLRGERVEEELTANRLMMFSAAAWLVALTVGISFRGRRVATQSLSSGKDECSE